MHKKDIYTASLNDFFSFKVFMVSLFSLIITIAIIFVLVYFSSEHIDKISNIATLLIEEKAVQIIDTIKSLPYINTLFESDTISNIVSWVLVATMRIAVYFLFFTLYGIVLGFFSETLIKMVQKRHYPTIKLKGMGMTRLLLFYTKTVMVSLILFIVLLPVYIVPGLNLIFLVVPYYFFYRTIVYEVSSVINSFDEYKKIKKVNKTELKGVAGICFAISMIPVIGILLYPFYMILMSHYILKETQELREVVSFQS